MAAEVNLWGVMVGAAVASVVPLVTLHLSSKRWKLEKRIEHLRLKHARLDKMYAAILDALPEALVKQSYPSAMTSQIHVHASAEVQEVFFAYMGLKEKDEKAGREFYLDIAVGANRHIAAVEKEIEDALT